MYPRLVLLAIAWGALAFGAVYPWGYWPLIITAGVLGIAGLAAPTPRRINVPFAAASLVLLLAVTLQLVPLPRHVLLSLSPAADRYFQERAVGYQVLVAAGQPVSHPLSIDPSLTELGLALGAGFVLFVLGAGRAFTGGAIRKLVPGIVALGAALSIVGIAQRFTYNGKVLWFWTPIAASFTPFGPFVNRNHFAGWMLMAIPLGVGYLIGLFTRSMRAAPPGWRGRIGWLATEDASGVIVVAVGIIAMALSLVMTFSRAGITCFIVALSITGLVVLRRAASRTQGVAILLLLCALAIGAIVSVGVDPLALRFDFSGREIDMRLGAWADALSVARQYPITGTGLNTYGEAMRAYQTFRVDTLHFAEAHNDYLQLLAEGGALVALPATLLLMVFVREVRRRFLERRDDPTGYWIRVGAVTGLVAVALQELVDFSLQMPGNAMLFAVLCAVAMCPAPDREARTSSAK